MPARPYQCSRCGERHPSRYYLIAGAAPAVCNRCMAGLDPAERERILEVSAVAAGEVLRRCLRCQRMMMRGELAYRDRSTGDDATPGFVQKPSDINRKLDRFGTRQKHTIVQRVKKTRLADPFLFLDQLGLHDRDLASRPAK